MLVWGHEDPIHTLIHVYIDIRKMHMIWNQKKMYQLNWWRPFELCIYQGITVYMQTFVNTDSNKKCILSTKSAY